MLWGEAGVLKGVDALGMSWGGGRWDTASSRSARTTVARRYLLLQWVLTDQNARSQDLQDCQQPPDAAWREKAGDATVPPYVWVRSGWVGGWCGWVVWVGSVGSGRACSVFGMPATNP